MEINGAKSIELLLRCQGDKPSLEDLHDLVIQMVLAYEDDDLDRAPFSSETIESYAAAYTHRAVEVSDHNNKSLKLVCGEEAEKLWWEAVEAGYRAGLGKYKDKARVTHEDLAFWPSYLSYQKSYSAKLVREIALTVGYNDGRHVAAMRDVYAATQMT